MSNNAVEIDDLIDMRESIASQKNFFVAHLQENRNFIEPKFQQIIMDLDNILEHIDNILKADCVHEYESDLIDITPDRSEQITYCRICNCTF